jgi:hypothetical protein
VGRVMGHEVVVAVTNGRLDGSTERSTEGFDRAQPRASRRGLAEVFGTWERILGVSWMADTRVLTGGGSGCWSRS